MGVKEDQWKSGPKEIKQNRTFRTPGRSTWSEDGNRNFKRCKSTGFEENLNQKNPGNYLRARSENLQVKKNVAKEDQDQKMRETEIKEDQGRSTSKESTCFWKRSSTASKADPYKGTSKKAWIEKIKCKRVELKTNRYQWRSKKIDAMWNQKIEI